MSNQKLNRSDTDIVHIDHTIFATRRAMSKNCMPYTIKYGAEIVEPVKKLEYELQLQGHQFVFKPLSKPYNAFTYPSISVAFIDPRRNSVEELMYTVVHESLHLEQVQKSVLAWDRSTQALLWNGIPFHSNTLPDHNNMPGYLDLPWEKDAREREVDLYRKVMNTNDIPPETPKAKRPK